MNSRAWVAAAVFLALLIGAFLVMRSTPSPEKKDRKIEAQSAPAPSIPSAPPPLDRADLIEAANKAADAAATGDPFPGDLGDLAGRRFALVIPFGCNGPGSSGADPRFAWNYDDADRTLRASVRPETWSDDDWVRNLVGPLVYEAAEGFWISRPWIRGGGCPRQPDVRVPADNALQANPDPEPRPGPELPVIQPRETLALVEFFAPDAPRAARRNGRPYALSAKVAPDEIDLSRGLRLLIEGRLVALPSGSPLACRVESSEMPPVCLIRVDVSKVAITGASGEQTLTVWND